MSTFTTSNETSGSSVFTISGSRIFHPCWKISCSEVILPSETVFQSLVFGIHDPLFLGPSSHRYDCPLDDG
jgi:hypothetical protein